MAAYLPKRRERGAWITPRNIERAACFTCCCMFLVIAWIAVNPHSFRAFVLGLLS